MPFSAKIKREIEVAFSKHAQPAWFRIVKYVVLLTAFYFFWREKLFWLTLLAVFVLGLPLHFWYRYKTKGWTRSYGFWNYDKNKPKQKNAPIDESENQ